MATALVVLSIAYFMYNSAVWVYCYGRVSVLHEEVQEFVSSGVDWDSEVPRIDASLKKVDAIAIRRLLWPFNVLYKKMILTFLKRR